MSLTVEQVDDGFGIKIISYMINIAEQHQSSIIGNNSFSKDKYSEDEIGRYMQNYFENWCSISFRGTCISDFYEDLVSQYIVHRWGDNKRILVIYPSHSLLENSSAFSRKLDRMNMIYDDQFEPNKIISRLDHEMMRENGFSFYKEAGEVDSSLLTFYGYDDVHSCVKPFWDKIPVRFDDIIHFASGKLLASSSFYDFLIQNTKRCFLEKKTFVYLNTGRFSI